MSIPYWSSAKHIFSWTICIFLLSTNGVLTEEEFEEPNYGSIRLVNGTEYSGRLEIFYEGEWGTVCNDGWTNKEADVVCRSLGFGSGKPFLVSPGSGKIFLADVKCTGNEASIFKCRHNNFEPHECTHDTDAGVSCEGVLNALVNTNTADYCTFDIGTCGYISTGNSSYKWLRRSGSTPSSSTGPSYDHTRGTTSGYYMYTEASSGYTGAKARLASSFSRRWINSLTFWYHMYGYNIGKLDVILESNRFERNVWSQSGDQGNLWQYACIPIRSSIQRVIFEGTRGNSYRGDIAIDDIYFSRDGCATKDRATCTFTNGMCGYQIIRGNDSSVTWSLTSASSYKAPIYDYSTNSTSGSYASMDVTYPREGMKSYLVSQPIEINGDMKVEFYYYMAGATPGELQVSFKDKSTPLNSWSKNDWQDNGDHGRRWNYGCMDLHPNAIKYGNMTKRIVFTGITGTVRGISLALDDIKVSNGSCGLGINDHVCTFDNTKLCHYKINCTAHQEYTWRRMRGPTSSLRTGPTRDVSGQSTGYYLYAESSYGKVGDAVSIKFPVKNTKGKYLKFNYHMYGQSMGSLHLRYFSGKSSKEVWKISGNQGDSWKFFCTRLNAEISAVMLVAVRGYTYTSDIAVDDVFLDTKPCPNPVNCNFENGMCNYTFSSDTYRYYRWIMKTGVDHTHGSGHYLMATSPSSMEGISTSMMTTDIKQSTNASSLQFYYKVSGSDPGKLIVQLNQSSVFNMANMMEPKSFRMDVEGWVMGCMDLPGNTEVFANFTAISGPVYGNSIMLDDIYYHESPCVVGILNEVCTFDQPNVCGYNVSCRDASQFQWKRGRRTNSSATGPNADHSKGGNGYFMYTESSFGSPGDTTDLEFPQFVTPPGHYLRFYYSMYGSEIGTLQVNIITPSGKMLKWFEKGDLGQNWLKGCVNLPVNESTTVVFTGIRGNGPLGDIAIDDVAVVPGVCHERSIACDFSDEMACGYKNQSHYKSDGWVRMKSNSGYYMTVRSQSGIYGLISPLGNLTDSCVQITYKILGDRCELIVYTSYNEKKQLHLQSLQNNATSSQKAQFYIRQAETHVIFEANIVYNWYSTCSIEIEQIEISNGTCPALVCSINSTSCEDQTQCTADSFLCDRVDNCLDSSDESNCPQTISCDFEDKYLCGYNFSYGWYHTELSNFANPDLYLNNSAYSMSLNSGASSLMSPKKTIQQSCLQFHYAGGTGSRLEVMAHYDDGRNSSKWNIEFTSLTKWTIGQFELSAGTVYLEFAGSASRLGLVIDNVNLQNGTCERIACPNDSFACASNEKCIAQVSKCNRAGDCQDNSDELNCPTSLVCDVEHPYQCGYEYKAGEWAVKSGREVTYPDLDNSQGLYSGRYFVSSFYYPNQSAQHNLYAPEEMLKVDACLTFYYSFHGSGEFEIFDNGKPMLTIRPNNINAWQKSQIQLSKGKHNITFSHKMRIFTNPREMNVLALDTIDISNGTCGFFECEEGWRKCPKSPICVPEFKFCDHDVDCPNGEDEKNCMTYSNVRLVGGRSVHQGFVELFFNGQWNKTCGSWYQRNAAVVCRELGYNGTARTTFKTQRSEYIYTSIRYVRCMGYEDNITDCSISSCGSYCSCNSVAAVDCSHTHCESTHVPCSSFNTSSNSSAINMTRCIPRESVCDGEKDCPGGTDEESCPKCRSNEFQCLNYECIPEAQRCDGINDCQDGSDEYHCFKHDKNDLSFMIDGKYIPVCEDNLKDQDIANKLCHYVGKGNASVGSSGKVLPQGVMFAYTAAEKRAVLPGFKPYLDTCRPLNLKCSRRECGTRSPNLYDPLIQHGHQALAGEFPWQVSLHLNSRFICGGILIDDRYVLTAAHCVRSSNYASNYKVFVGSTLRYGGQRYSINKIMSHKNFSMSLLRNDVAVLELSSAVRISDYVRPICLPSKLWVPNTQCFTTGWGRIEDNSQPNDLMETKVYLMSREKCQQDYLRSDETTVCANHKQPNQPGCYGDSGGPLVCRNEQGYWEVIGVTSYGRVNCAGHVSSPQVYADVYTLRNWILSKMSF